MADRRPEVDGHRLSKRRKTEGEESNPNSLTPHKYEEPTDDSGSSSRHKKLNTAKSGSFDATAKAFLTQKYESPTEESGNKNRFSKPNKTKTEHLDPKANPYLAHMYEDSTEDLSYNNGYGKPDRGHRIGNASALAKFPRHGTTAAMAKEAENGPNNPFSGRPLSTQYFNLLQNRRNLPVHAQR